MKKRFLSALLALCMVLTMLPLTGLTAFAADEHDEEIIDIDVYKAECLAGVAKDDHSDAVEQCNRLYNYYINENILSPTQSFLDSMHENESLMALYTVWQAYSLELTPSAALNRVVTTEDYYESIVLAMMQKALQEQSDLKQLLNNKIMNASKDMVSRLCEITSAADAAELANTMDLFDPDTYDSVTEAISETYAVGTASKVIDNVSLILEAAENVVDAVDRFAVYASMVELDESAKLWLEQMYNACDAQTPVELKTAISNLKNASTGFADAALVNVQETTFAIANWSVQKVLDAGLGAAAAMNPVTQAVWIGLQASKTICDIFFGSDEVGEQLCVMECIYFVQDLSRRVAEGCKNTFLGERTTTNAQAFNYAVDCYYESIINIDIDCMLTFLDKLYNGGLDLGSAGGILTDGNMLSWIYGTPADYQEIVDDLEGLRQARIQNKQHMETYFRVALKANYPATFNYYFANLNEVPVTDLYIYVSYYLPLEYEFDADELRMVEGDYGRFYVSYDPDDATLTDYTVEVSDPEVVQVKDGIIQALKPGTATVTVTSTQNDLVFDTQVVTVLERIEGAQGDGDLASRRFTYTVTNGAATITGLEDGYTPSVLYIPATIDEYPVTGIGSSAFEDYDSLTRVTIPDSVTSIGALAFFNCDSLTSVTIGNGVTSIGNYAFRYCRLLTSITIPDSVTSIGNSAFANCDSLTSVLIPGSVTSIGSSAFYGCTSLTSITIPGGVTSIGSSAFYGCTSLTSITIPGSVTSIGSSAFYGCTSLTSITIPDSVTSIEEKAFYDCSSLENIVIGDGVTSLNAWDFSNYDSLKSVTIGNGVTSIGHEEFSGCDSLTNVTIGNGVTSIGDSAFTNCDSLTSIIIPDSVTSIGYEAFAFCDSLTNVTIGNGVTSIGERAFFNCDSLTSITIPDSVTSIGGSTFYNCDSLTSVIIGNGVTSIGDYAFSRCVSLTSVTIPDSVTSIGINAFVYCDALTSVNIGNSVTSMGYGAFSGCDSLTSVTIGNGVTSIGERAFYDCDSLTNITIPDSLTSIGYGAFSGCDSLTSVSIPDSVTSIGEHAFSGCTSLTSVTIGNGVTSIGERAFYDCDSLTNITIPDSVTSVGDCAFSSCDSLTSITVDNGNPNYSSENGVLFNKDKTELIQYPKGKTETAYTIPNSVTSIGGSTFYNCSSLTSITIPNSVTSIGEHAFSGCTSLTSITIPDSVTSMGDGAFSSCVSLTSIAIPDSVTSIGDSAFANCNSLTSVSIEVGVTSIGNQAFAYCGSLANITIPNSVTSIGDYVFFYCFPLTSITIPDSVTSIGEYTFSSGGSLTIYGYPGSYVETYALENDIPFVPILMDSVSGVTIEDATEALPENTQLTVEQVAASADGVTYDITLTQNGVTVQPTGAVTVKIPVPDTMDGNLCRVYREEADGTYTDMNAVYQNGYMVFITDHFSQYVLTTQELENPTVTLGDVNEDGKVDAVDARWVLQAAAGMRTLENMTAADVNADGKIDAVDARWILQAAAGMRTLGA